MRHFGRNLAARGVGFVFGLILCCVVVPTVFLMVWEQAFCSLHLVGLLVSGVAMLAWLTGGRFFAPVRIRLTPCWQAGLLVWLIPLVVMGFVLAIFWQVTGPWALPWFAEWYDGLDAFWFPLWLGGKKMALIASGYVLTFLLERRQIFSRRMYHFLRVLLLAFFAVTCARVAFGVMEIMCRSFGNTWDTGEVWDGLFVPYWPYLAGFIGIALVPAWALTAPVPRKQ